MDLTRTLTVKIDPSGAVSGGNAAAGAFKSVGTSAAAMDQNIRTANKSLRDMAGGGGGGASGGGSMGAAVTGATGMAGAFKMLAGAVAGIGLAAFGRSMIETKISMDRIGNSLRFAAGGAKEGAESFAWLASTSKLLGLDFEASAKAFSQFAAATRGSSITFAETQRIFLSVAKASSVLGLSADTSAGALNALQQMVSKGTVSAEEMRQQFAERIPGAMAAAERAMGLTSEQFQQMLNSGQIMAADLLPKLATELEKTFGPHAAASANTLGAEMNRLSNSWKGFKTALMESGVGEFFTDLIRLVRKSLDEVSGFFKYLKDAGGSLKDIFSAAFPGGSGAVASAIGQRMALGGEFGNPLPAAEGAAPVRNIGDITVSSKLTPFEKFRKGMGDSPLIEDAQMKKQEYKIMGAMSAWRQAGQQTSQALTSGFDGFFAAMVEGTLSVTDAFKNMTKSILQDIAKIVLHNAIAAPIAAAISGSLGIGGGVRTTGVPKSHTGSLVGIFGGTSTNVDPSIFRNAPRFHSGLMPDEFPAILQKGEAVIPKSQVGSMGGGGVNVSVTVNMESSGNADEDGNKVGGEVARQVENMVRSILVRERRPRGMLA